MNEENLKQILKMQEENYAYRKGTVFGIYRIDNVEYNWITHTQEWTVSCTKCGHTEVVPRSVGADWIRGKGRSRYKCKYCKEKEKEKEKERQSKKEAIGLYLDSFLNTEINGWSISGRNGSKFHLFCQTCGRERDVQKKDVESKNVCPCKHPKNFGDKKYIGKRYGHLTVIDYSGGMFLTRCDCGFEKHIKPSLAEKGKISTCGRLECKFHKQVRYENGTQGGLINQRGRETEDKIAEYIEELGYRVRQTEYSGDYGVDLIALGNGMKLVALQIKNNTSTGSPVGVSAVQEVYAGGKFYDCDKFAVVSYTGYTENAKIMADKLDVMLLTEKCELYDFSKKFSTNTKHFWIVDGSVEPMIETFKKNGWGDDCYRFVNMDYQQVKKYFDHIAEKKERVKLLKENGISHQLIHYRMKTMGMTFEQAIATPKLQTGRPRKTE